MLNGIFIENFAPLSDPRIERQKKHLLLDIISISLCAIVAGAQSFVEISDFGNIHHKWLQQFLALPNGIPSHDTFLRVFSLLEPDAFESCFLNWLTQIATLLPEEVVAIDGKALRGSHRRQAGLKALHIVSAWSCQNGISLGQLKVDGKTNEITAIPQLLKKLALDKAIVTIDAMGCQKKIAKHIVDDGCDYILGVKGNQESLMNAINAAFTHAEKHSYQDIIHDYASDEINNDHGRIESRQCYTLPLMYQPELQAKWPGLKSLIQIKSTRETNGCISEEKRQYISSLDYTLAEKLLRSIRSHWQVENNLHWQLDISFREDESRVRDETAAVNLAWVRKTALTCLKRETSYKASIRRKQLKAWADTNYLAKIIGN
jgi:predicted transposase YbfD/YdcC